MTANLWSYQASCLSCHINLGNECLIEEFIQADIYHNWSHLFPLPCRYQKRALQECLECDPPFTLDSFLFPIGQGVPEELRAENLALFLMLIACFVALWCISRPWWHKHSTFLWEDNFDFVDCSSRLFCPASDVLLFL